MRRPKTAAVTATDTAMTAPQMRRRRHSLPIDRVRARLQRPESCTSSAARDLHVAPAVPLPRLKLGTGLGRGRAAAHSSSHEPGGAAGLGRDMTGTSFCGLSELPTWRVAT